jgi:hypothetical protein
MLAQVDESSRIIESRNEIYACHEMLLCWVNTTNVPSDERKRMKRLNIQHVVPGAARLLVTTNF